MINIVNEIYDLLNKYNLNLNDVILAVEGNIVKSNEFLEKYDISYDNDWGLCELKNIQLIVDDYAWFERTSYDGRERFILKAHPLLKAIMMITAAWIDKAERHIDICEIYFNMWDYPFIINSCFLAMYSVIKALFVLKNIECKTLEGLIYLLKVNYVDENLFDKNLFKFFCNTKELNSEFLQINWDIFDEKMAMETFNNTKIFTDYSKDLLNDLSKMEPR